MYPYDFNPRLKGLNPEEVFVVMPFAPVYDPIYTELVEPAVRAAGTTLQRSLRAYRTKGDFRTTSGWIEVMEHLYTAQIILGVLTSTVNANVQYELGIAHATQPICRQVLIAEKDYKPQFDTKDLIFMEYSYLKPGDSVEELAARIRTALEGWNVNEEIIVRHAVAKLPHSTLNALCSGTLCLNSALGPPKMVRVSTSGKWLSAAQMIKDFLREYFRDTVMLLGGFRPVACWRSTQ